MFLSRYAIYKGVGVVYWGIPHVVADSPYRGEHPPSMHRGILSRHKPPTPPATVDPFSPCPPPRLRRP